MTFEVRNGSEWGAAMSGALVDLELGSEESVVKLAGDMAKLMREGAPVMSEDDRRRRQSTKSGRESVRRKPGKTSIRFRRGRDARGFFVDVGPHKSAFYLAFAEWGTSRQAATPFLRPAIERAIARWR